MNIQFNNNQREVQELEVNKVTVLLNEDVEYQISVNKFGELVVQKQNFGEGETPIILKPSVSNEIRLL